MDLLKTHKKDTRPVFHRVKKILFIVIPIIIVGIIAYFGIYGYRAYTIALKLQSEISVLQTAADKADIGTITKQLDPTYATAKDLDSTLSAMRPLAIIPFLGKQYSAAATATHAGVSLLSDAQRSVGILDALAKALNGSKIESLRDVTETQKGIILGVLQQQSTVLHDIQQDIIAQAGVLASINTVGLHPKLASTIQSAQEPIGKVANILAVVGPLLDKGPNMLGYPTQKTYLFLMENNSEVRATGGFIGNYGILKLHNGEIKEFHTDNIYNIDDKAKNLHIPPPAPFAKYFKTNQWFLRDSNWSPDFSESAKRAISFYQQEGGKEHVDGVIAMTQDFIVPLLRFTGPIEVEGIVFTADNFEEELQYQVEKGYYQQGIPESQRKEIIGELSDRIMQRLYKLPPDRLPDLLSTIQRLVQERQLMVYFNDPALQDYARSQNWTGEFQKTNSDFVMVVDSNMAALKTDLVMDKYIDYTLSQGADGNIVATVDLYYTNNGTFTWYTTRYRDWVRIYVPDGSTFISSDGAMEKELSDVPGKVEVGKELDKTYFGAYIVVEPKATKHFQVQYKLPARIADQIKAGTYQLTAQKQAGVLNQQFKAKLTFNKPIKSYEPVGFFNTKTDRNSVQLQSDLRVDRFFTVTF